MCIQTLMMRMIQHDHGDPKRIQHFIKVHSLARTIGIQEGLQGEVLFALEAAALVHDIGIRLCEEKYGHCNGKLQEQEGPPLAEALLQELNVAPEVLQRVSYLAGHHHTYSNIDGLDYQILVGADFLVNLYEDHWPLEKIQAAVQNIFRTQTGIAIAREMFGI